jgi:hypothetical protein
LERYFGIHSMSYKETWTNLDAVFSFSFFWHLFNCEHPKKDLALNDLSKHYENPNKNLLPNQSQSGNIVKCFQFFWKFPFSEKIPCNKKLERTKLALWKSSLLSAIIKMKILKIKWHNVKLINVLPESFQIAPFLFSLRNFTIIHYHTKQMSSNKKAGRYLE